MPNIPADQTSTARAVVGQAFIETTQDGNDKDAIGIELTGGQTYRITLGPGDSSPSASFDPFISDILNSTGVSLGVSDDDRGSGLSSSLIYTPEETGTYFIVAGTPSPVHVGGSYSLLVDEYTQQPDDFSADLDAVNAIAVWETQNATIEQVGDTDTIALSLTAGQAVDITVYGNNHGGLGDLVDPQILSFRDASGNVIDAGNYALADATQFATFKAYQITYTPTQSGTYHITIGGLEDATGAYSVSVSEKDLGIYSIRENEPFVDTGNVEIDAFFSGHSSRVDNIFTDRDGDGFTTLTYSIPGADAQFSTAMHNPVASAPHVNYAPATGIVLETYKSIIQEIGSFSKVKFVEVPDDGVMSGTFRIGISELPMAGPGFRANGWSGFPEWMSAGETWLNVTQAAKNIALTTIDLQQFLINRTLHEFTHNLGLNHADRSTLASQIAPELQGQEYSVMARTSSGQFGDEVYGDLQPQTLMWFDIQAIQGAYGTNTEDTAGANSFSINTDGRNYSTIWDYGGEDSLTLTGSADTVINLTPGTWQDVGTEITFFGANGAAVGVKYETVFIAPDTVIENVTGAAGNDKITGNSAGNRIFGGDGNDVIAAGDGDDRGNGGKGNDIAELGSGNDTFYAGAGDEGNDAYRGGAGNDILGGGAGNDTLIGGGTLSVVTFSSDSEVVSGANILFGGAGDDQMVLGTWHDSGGINERVDAGEGLSQVGDGNGTAWGGLGRDIILGGGGNDRIGGGAGADLLEGGNGNDSLFAGAGDDADTIDGGAGDDLIFGAGGDDIIDAGAGADEIWAGVGDDQITGGTGADTFKFASGFGSDTITDFAVAATGGDILDLSEINDLSLATISEAATFDALGARLVISEQDTIFLSAVDEAGFQALLDNGQLLVGEN
ncbi:MAG: hypothetical protein AB3N28_10700 [Kordiimonas sp.]